MDIVKASVLYLSGTGTTEKCARAFAEGPPYDVEIVPLRHDEEPPQAWVRRRRAQGRQLRSPSPVARCAHRAGKNHQNGHRLPPGHLLL